MNKKKYYVVLSIYLLIFISLIISIALNVQDKRMAGIFIFMSILYPFIDLFTTNYLKDYFKKEK